MPSVPIEMPSETPIVKKRSPIRSAARDALSHRVGEQAEVHVARVAVVPHRRDADLRLVQIRPRLRPMPYSIACDAPCDFSSVMRALMRLSFAPLSGPLGQERAAYHRAPPAAGRRGAQETRIHDNSLARVVRRAADASRCRRARAESPPRTAARAVARTEQREPCAASRPAAQRRSSATCTCTPASRWTRARRARARRRATPTASRAARRSRSSPRRATASRCARVRLERPLDFAAVTDHAEQIGEVHICKTPGAPGYDSLVCCIYRGWPRAAFFVMNAALLRAAASASASAARTAPAASQAAQLRLAARSQAAAEDAYDRSAACRFTSFVGYEWTSRRRQRQEPPPQRDLPQRRTCRRCRSARWRRRRRRRGCGTRSSATACDGTPGCDVLTIPHNSNLERRPDVPVRAASSARAIDADEARCARAGSRWSRSCSTRATRSACPAATRTDEACGFEKLPVRQLRRALHVARRRRRRSRTHFVREALKRGPRATTRSSARIRSSYGIIASTDTHLGTPGARRASAATPGTAARARPTPSELPAGLARRARVQSRRPRRALGRGELARRAVRRDAAPRGLRHERHAPGRALLRRLRAAAPTCASDAGLRRQGLRATACRWAASCRRGPRAARAALRRCSRAPATPGSARSPASPSQRVQIVKGWLDATGATHEQVLRRRRRARTARASTRAPASRAAAGTRACARCGSDPDFDPARARLLLRARAREPDLPLEPARVRRAARRLREARDDRRGASRAAARPSTSPSCRSARGPRRSG